MATRPKHGFVFNKNHVPSKSRAFSERPKPHLVNRVRAASSSQRSRPSRSRVSSTN